MTVMLIWLLCLVCVYLVFLLMEVWQESRRIRRLRQQTKVFYLTHPGSGQRIRLDADLLTDEQLRRAVNDPVLRGSWTA